MGVSHWFRNVFRQQQVDRDLEAELSSYVDLSADEKVKGGASVEAARRSALVEMDGVEHVKESVRDARSGALTMGLAQDVRYALRMLRKNPGFTIAAVLALALGIGANTAIFSVVNSVLLRPLPYQDPDRIVVLLHNVSSPVAPANYLDWRDQNHVFESMGAAEYWTPNLADENRPEHLYGLKLSPSMFPLLGVQPLMGRTFQSGEDVEGRDHEIVLSYRLWQRQFAGDPNILGRTLKLNGEQYNVIGVMPPSFRFAPFWATKAELWVPLSLGNRATSRKGSSLRIFARLKAGVSLQQAQAEMATITARLDQQFPGSNRNVHVYPLEEKVVGDIRPALLILLGAVGTVLLIACANVAHMLLARAAARKKEIAVRVALGAQRSRLIRQFLTESLLLSSLAGIAGLLLGIWGLRILIAMTPANMPRMETTSLDWHVLLFTFAISVLTGVIFGLAPALQGSKTNLGDGLKESERGSTEGFHRAKLRSVLIGSEFALALVLLVGASLLIRTFVAISHVDGGFDPHNILSMIVSVAGTAEQDPSRRALFFQQYVQKLRANSSVESAAAINHLPLAGDVWGLPFYVEGQAPLPQGEHQAAVYRVITPGYFATMRASLLRGRDFTDSDDFGAPGVVIVNETLAKKFWPNADPVGRRLTMSNPSLGGNSSPADKIEWLTVVGVVRDLRQDDWTSELDPEVYLPYLQSKDYRTSDTFAMNYMTVVVRTRTGAAAFVPEAKAILATMDREVPISEVQTLEDVVRRSNSQAHFYMVLLGTFASVALLLAAVGIYAVMSYTVSRRTHEIGIRMALGARQRDVLKLVVGQGMIVAVIGAAVGLAGSLLLVRLMKTLLYGVQPTDPLTFVAVPLLLCSIALLATYVPARRAARVDPMRALRCE